MSITTENPRARRLRAKLAGARLYLITGIEDTAADPAELVRRALEGGVDIVQLRDKAADRAALLRAGRLFRALCDEHEALFIVNDDPGLAVECAADGVHVGQDDMAVEDARAALGPEPLIGISTHDPDQIDAALRSAADYLGVGPVHATPTKPGRPAVGESLVRVAAARADRPFFAIGGIDAANAGAVVAAGARRIAVVRAIRDAEDPRAAAVALRAHVGGETQVGRATTR